MSRIWVAFNFDHVVAVVEYYHSSVSGQSLQSCAGLGDDIGFVRGRDRVLSWLLVQLVLLVLSLCYLFFVLSMYCTVELD